MLYLIPGVNNTNSCVIFKVPSFTFIKHWNYNGISEFIWNTIFCLYLLKNCSNLSLKSSSVFLSNSELILSSPGLVSFLVNFKVSSNSSDVIKVYM